jgi:predicted CoA-substrate-specific enzyme activase
MKRIGIDIGALYLGAVVLQDGKAREVQYREHRGDIHTELERILKLPAYQSFDTIGITGNFPDIRQGVVDNTLAQIEGARILLPECSNVFTIGGQTFSLIFFTEEGGYKEHSINAPCAAGTGSFIEQQAERLGLSVVDLATKAAEFEGKTPVIATRCAVFAKTDIIHAMQEGYSLEAVCAGLCEGIARNVTDALIKGREIEDPVGFIGGVSLNRAIAGSMEKILGKEIRIPARSQVAGAIGAARLGDQREYRSELVRRNSRDRTSREPLQISLSHYPDFSSFSITGVYRNRHRFHQHQGGADQSGEWDSGRILHSHGGRADSSGAEADPQHQRHFQSGRSQYPRCGHYRLGTDDYQRAVQRR